MKHEVLIIVSDNLRYIADPGYQKSVADIRVTGIHQTTVSKTIAEVMEKILQKAHLCIKVPSTNGEIREAPHTRTWQQVFTFPAAIEVLHCTHVRISKPASFGDEYINRKGYASSMHRKHLQV
nr:unnamed protein product [Callosobruchus analis]